jgi:hypothetical protein
MVAAGTSNDEVMAARGIRPLFDEDDSAGPPLGASSQARGQRFGSVDDAATGIVIGTEDALGGPSAASASDGSGESSASDGSGEDR